MIFTLRSNFINTSKTMEFFPSYRNTFLFVVIFNVIFGLLCYLRYG